MKVGLIGEKLGHSFSKPIHEQLADYTYNLIPLSIEEFENFMEQKAFDAINVTIPYKEKVIPYCDYIDEKAIKIGAINAIKNVDGKLFATNTDYDGLKMMIENHFDLSGKIIAICGSGGTAKTAFAVCENLSAKEIIQVGRNKTAPFISYEELKKRKDIEIIINTTSVGMNPDILSEIVNIDDFPSCKGVIDVVYNPLLTCLCYSAKQKNIPYICGLEMLVGQAVSAVKFFTDKSIDKNVILGLTKKIYKEKQNIVLIGMPSCGKSTIGKKISQIIGYDFVDMDIEIEKYAGISIPQIFEKYGEDYFRDLESKVCVELAKRNHTVISCGGGVIKKEINMKALSLNGKIIFIKRDLDKLITGGNRPLSKDFETLKKMEKERNPLYQKYSSVIIENNGEISDTIEKLLEVYSENFGY